jgi:hypothetical protein
MLSFLFIQKLNIKPVLSYLLLRPYLLSNYLSNTSLSKPVMQKA